MSNTNKQACGVCGLVDQALSYMDEILAAFKQQPRRPTPSGPAHAEQQRLDAITFNLAMQVRVGLWLLCLVCVCVCVLAHAGVHVSICC